MRALYQERRDTLLDATARELEGRAHLGPTDAGLHATAYLRPGSDDRRVARRAATHGLDVAPLSRYSLRPTSRPGLVLGYGALPPAVIRERVRALGRVLRAV